MAAWLLDCWLAGPLARSLDYGRCRGVRAQVEEVTEEFAMFPADRTELAPVVSDWGHRAGDPSRPGQDADATYLHGKVQELLAADAPDQ